MLKYLLILLTFFAMACSNGKEAQEIENSNSAYNLETVTNTVDVPWGMDWLPDGSMLVTQRSGNLYLFSDGSEEGQIIEGVPDVFARSQGGLLDVVVHPQYEENGWIYITYSSTEGGGGANTALMRARLNDDRNGLTDHEVLYKAEPNTNRGHHFGSRIVFDNEGYVYFAIGDRGNRDVNPQDITRDAGKIYRLHDDGRIPEDNPFVDKSGAKKAIYSYGHRNPQGLVLHSKTGVLWEHEHGPRGGDEINIIQKGKNYGWPVITYGINYSGTEITDETSRPGMEQPLYQWTPSIAPSGMAFVTSDKYPKWEDNLLVGSLAFQYLERLEIKDNQVVYREKLLDGMGRVRNVRQAPDGFIYISIEGKGIYRLVPK